MRNSLSISSLSHVRWSDVKRPMKVINFRTIAESPSTLLNGTHFVQWVSVGPAVVRAIQLLLRTVRNAIEKIRRGSKRFSDNFFLSARIEPHGTCLGKLRLPRPLFRRTTVGLYFAKSNTTFKRFFCIQ